MRTKTAKLKGKIANYKLRLANRNLKLANIKLKERLSKCKLANVTARTASQHGKKQKLTRLCDAPSIMILLTLNRNPRS